MAKFLYYIVDLMDAQTLGTNDVDVVRTYLESDEHVIIQSQEGQVWHGPEGDVDFHDIQELKLEQAGEYADPDADPED